MTISRWFVWRGFRSYFCGESMFSKVSNASKMAFIALAKQLEIANYRLLDCKFTMII